MESGDEPVRVRRARPVSCNAGGVPRGRWLCRAARTPGRSWAATTKAIRRPLGITSRSAWALICRCRH